MTFTKEAQPALTQQFYNMVVRALQSVSKQPTIEGIKNWVQGKTGTGQGQTPESQQQAAKQILEQTLKNQLSLVQRRIANEKAQGAGGAASGSIKAWMEATNMLNQQLGGNVIPQNVMMVAAFNESKMMKIASLIEEIVDTANEMDRLGLTSQADSLDEIMHKIAAMYLNEDNDESMYVQACEFWGLTKTAASLSIGDIVKVIPNFKSGLLEKLKLVGGDEIVKRVSSYLQDAINPVSALMQGVGNVPQWVGPVRGIVRDYVMPAINKATSMLQNGQQQMSPA